MSQSALSSRGLRRKSSEVSEVLVRTMRARTAPEISLPERSSEERLHVSERSTSASIWPTAASVSLLLASLSDVHIEHEPDASSSHRRGPPRSADAGQVEQSQRRLVRDVEMLEQAALGARPRVEAQRADALIGREQRTDGDLPLHEQRCGGLLSRMDVEAFHRSMCSVGTLPLSFCTGSLV